MSTHKRSAYISSPARKRLPKKRRNSHFWSKTKRFFVNYKTIILIGIIVLLITTIIKLIFAYTIGKQENIISEVLFTDESVQMYDDKDMYNTIRENLYGENIILLKLHNGGDAKNAITKSYPFIENLSLEKVWPGSILANIVFKTADLVFVNDTVRVAYTNDMLTPIREADSIASGAIEVTLPDYFSWEKIEQYATGYISLIGAEKLHQDLLQIVNVISPSNILFLIGSQKSIISTDNTEITFDHKRDIAQQLLYLETIQWLDTTTQYEINLTTYPKVIIKKLGGGTQ